MSERAKALIVEALCTQPVEIAVTAALSGDSTALRAIILTRDLDQAERKLVADFVREICKRSKRRPINKQRAEIIDFGRRFWRKFKAEAKQSGKPSPSWETFISVYRDVLAEHGIAIAETTLKNDLLRSRKSIKTY